LASIYSAEIVYSHRLWAESDVCGLFSVSVGSFLDNVGLNALIFSVNVGMKLRCFRAELFIFSGRYTYQAQHTTVEPGFRWIKTPAAIAPVWLETPDRIAALARLPGLGLLVYSGIPRQVRLSLLTHDQQLPGHKGLTATPTAAVVWTWFAQVARVQRRIDEPEVTPLSGVQPHPLLVCDALGLDSSWSAVPSIPKNARDTQTP
jgi:hypothetical protein